jgi:hypothetical protein
MRVSVIHESQGAIIGLAASPTGAPVANLVPKAGERVTEVDVPELSAGGGAQQIFERLADMVENYRIDVPSNTLRRKHD